MNIASSVSRTGTSLVHHSSEASAVSRTSLLPLALPVRYFSIWISSSIVLSLGAVGGTESLGITAGETKNPGKNMPRVVKFVFWRCVAEQHFALPAHEFCSILLFYLLSILLIGLNGAHFTQSLDILPNLRPTSSLGLPRSFQQDRNHVTLYDRIQTIRIQCVSQNLIHSS
jgi:amino acid transporter